MSGAHLYGGGAPWPAWLLFANMILIFSSVHRVIRTSGMQPHRRYLANATLILVQLNSICWTVWLLTSWRVWSGAYLIPVVVWPLWVLPVSLAVFGFCVIPKFNRMRPIEEPLVQGQPGQ